MLISMDVHQIKEVRLQEAQPLHAHVFTTTVTGIDSNGREIAITFYGPSAESVTIKRS